MFWSDGKCETQAVCKREFQSLGSLTNRTPTPYWVVISKSDLAVGMGAYDQYESREPDEFIGATHFAYWVEK